MKIAATILAVLLGLLSIAAGGAKVALVPEEVAFLSQFGFGTGLTVSFGAVQVLAGVLMVVPLTRPYGAALAALAFSLSAALLASTGDLAFAGVSLLPTILAGVVAYQSASARRAAALAEGEA